MLGGYISDLEPATSSRPSSTSSPPSCAASTRTASEEGYEPFHSAQGGNGRQIRPPTLIHVDKMRILEENCLKSAASPARRRRTPASTTVPRGPATARPMSASASSSAGRSSTSMSGATATFLCYYLRCTPRKAAWSPPTTTRRCSVYKPIEEREMAGRRGSSSGPAAAGALRRPVTAASASSGMTAA